MNYLVICVIFEILEISTYPPRCARLRAKWRPRTLAVYRKFVISFFEKKPMIYQ